MDGGFGSDVQCYAVRPTDGVKEDGLCAKVTQGLESA
jgi:hypothetical protein